MVLSSSVARRSQEWTRACYGLLACLHGWFFGFPHPHTYQEVCRNAYNMTVIQRNKFRTRKQSSEHTRRHHRQHRQHTIAITGPGRGQHARNKARACINSLKISTRCIRSQLPAPKGALSVACGARQKGVRRAGAPTVAWARLGETG